MDITSKKKHVSITFEFEDARIMERASLRPPGCLRHGQSAGHWECKFLNSAPVGGSLPTQRANSDFSQCLLKEFENMLLLAPSLPVLALRSQDSATSCVGLGQLCLRLLCQVLLHWCDSSPNPGKAPQLGHPSQSKLAPHALRWRVGQKRCSVLQCMPILPVDGHPGSVKKIRRRSNS